MKQYETINWYLEGIEKVYDFLYNELEEEEQSPFFSWLMQQFPDLDIDWLEIFEDFNDDLFLKGEIDTILSFVEWYKQKKPDDYSEKYEFIERGICDYYLYKNDFEKLQERINFIQQNPVSGIDTLTVRLQYQLIYHAQYQTAFTYAEAVWKPVNESDKLMGFAVYPFINTIYVNQLQKCYETGLNATPFDKEQLFRKMVTMGFDDDKSIFKIVLNTLKEELHIDDIKDSIQKGKDGHLLVLNIQFLKYMLHTYQMPFIFSEWIWNFIATKKIFGKHKGIDNWFYIDAGTLSKHISDKFDSYLGSNELEIFGKVWGLDFVFSFLNKHQLLSDEHFEKMRESITYFRNEMIISAGSDLWQMMFVFKWPRTNDFIVDPSEQRLFNETYGKDENEVFETVNRYLSIYRIPDRIKKELNLNYSTKGIILPFEAENTPDIKVKPDTGRNDLCPCGSGKKYKKCCLNK